MKIIHWMIKNFPADLHKEIKLQAVREEISMKDLVVKVFTEYLKKKGGKK